MYRVPRWNRSVKLVVGNGGCKKWEGHDEREREMWGASACGHGSFTFAMASQLFENARW